MYAPKTLPAIVENPAVIMAWSSDLVMSGVQDQPGQHGETLSLLKLQNISRVWWWAPVIPVTQEAEAGEYLEPRRQRLQNILNTGGRGGSELKSHHCTPAWVIESLKKREKYRLIKKEGKKGRELVTVEYCTYL
uniref:Uncharacterized protein n=1 Tax=Callithrix jacchus TaxID=9483 RepID=A0A8I3WPW6_CALJA